MNWATPALALWASVFVIPALLLLYFLKLKRRDQEVSTTLLWKKAIQDLQANAPFQKLRRNILLLLQLLALAAVLMALGQPELSDASSTSHRHVIMLDRSASMSTRDSDNGDSRLEIAKREALDFIGSLRDPSSGLGGIYESTIGQLLGSGEADEAMIIVFDANAQVRQSFTTDKSLLRQAIESVEPTDAPSTIDEALRLAGAFTTPELIEDQGLVLPPTADLHVWSDGNLLDIEDVSLPPQTTFAYHAMGEPTTGNLAITAASIERSYDQPEQLSVFVSAQSTGEAPRQVDAEFSLDGRVVGIRRVNLTRPDDAQPGDPWIGGVVFTVQFPQGGSATVRLLVDDALDRDDKVTLRIDPAHRLSVGLVTSGNLFLQTALEGMNLERLTIIMPSELDRLVDRDQLSEFDVLVLDGIAPPVRNSSVVPGRFLVFNAMPAMSGLSLAEPITDPTVVLEWSRDHEALALANLDQLVIGEHLGLIVDAPSVVLARSEHGPIIAESLQGAARLLLVAFDPTSSTWPFDPGFVLFLASSTQYLGDRPGSSGTDQLTPGQTLSTRIPGNPSRVTLTTPDNRSVSLIPSEGGDVVYGPIRHAGRYTLRWRDGGDNHQRVIPVNLLSAAESDVGTRETLELASRTVQAERDGSSSRRRPLWPWLILLAMGIILLEWYIYNKKVML